MMLLQFRATTSECSPEATQPKPSKTKCCAPTQPRPEIRNRQSKDMHSQARKQKQSAERLAQYLLLRRARENYQKTHTRSPGTHRNHQNPTPGVHLKMMFFRLELKFISVTRAFGTSI